MTILRTQAKQAIQRVRNGSLKDLGEVLTAIVDGDMRSELDLIDARARSTLFDDFLAAAIDGRWSSTAGSGTGNAAATTVAGALNGTITLKSASDDGAHSANLSTITTDQLNYTAAQGGLLIEARCKISDVSEAYFFVGFTDTISTTVEAPIFMNAGVIDSDAANACGVVYDVDATTDVFTVGGVKADTDTDPQLSTVTPVDDTYFTVRVEVSAAGAVQGFINGNAIGNPVANAVTTSTPLTPAVFIGNRSANQVTLTVDYIMVKGNR